MTAVSRRTTVCVVGGVNVDLVVRVPTLPSPGETVSGGAFTQSVGGKAANQAVAAQRLGALAHLVASVGDDAFGDLALAALRGEGVDVSRVRVRLGVATGVALICVDDAGENSIAVAPGANDLLDALPDDTTHFDATLCLLEAPDAVLIDTARRALGLLVLNAAPARAIPEELLSRTDVLIANEGEHAAIEGQLADFTGIVIVTLGSKGAIAQQRGVTLARATPPAVRALDSVGAGDAFCGCLVVDLARGLPIAEALERACVAGALATTALGAQSALPRADAVTALWRSSGSG
ncbi:unannotated protein [freshwater metagenome]|uniref:Unannotated protein n=1 Tax=freshwater metagenome TaxID=449393 RepID=A0A6J7NIN9_9ZZZZ